MSGRRQVRYNGTMSPIDSVLESAPRTTALRSDYRAPAFEVITLDCEITSYAPAGDDPLF